jgi:hypothetical protein
MLPGSHRLACLQKKALRDHHERRGGRAKGSGAVLVPKLSHIFYQYWRGKQGGEAREAVVGGGA